MSTHHFITKDVAERIVINAREITREKARRSLNRSKVGSVEELPTGAILCKAFAGPTQRARYFLRSMAPDGADVKEYL